MAFTCIQSMHSVSAVSQSAKTNANDQAQRRKIRMAPCQLKSTLGAAEEAPSAPRAAAAVRAASVVSLATSGQSVREKEKMEEGRSDNKPQSKTAEAAAAGTAAAQVQRQSTGRENERKRKHNRMSFIVCGFEMDRAACWC